MWRNLLFASHFKIQLNGFLLSYEWQWYDRSNRLPKIVIIQLFVIINHLALDKSCSPEFNLKGNELKIVIYIYSLPRVMDCDHREFIILAADECLDLGKDIITRYLCRYRNIL